MVEEATVNRYVNLEPQLDKVAFSLNSKTKIVVRFLDDRDGRDLPFECEAVKDGMYRLKREERGRELKETETRIYYRNCGSEAIRSFRKSTDPKEDLQERHLTVLAINALMVVRYKNGKKTLEAGQRMLR